MSSSLGVHLIYGMYISDLPDHIEFYDDDGEELDSCDISEILEGYDISKIFMYDSEDDCDRLVGYQMVRDTDWSAVEITDHIISEGKEIGLLKWKELYPDMTHEDLKMYISPSYF